MPDKKIYFNNSATSFPKAPGVSEAVRDSLESIPPDQERSGFACADRESQCRRLIKNLIDPSGRGRVILCSNATHALNMAIFGIGLKRNDIVLTSATEHNSVIRPLFHLKRDKKIRIATACARNDGSISKDDFLEKLKNFTPKLVVLNHASNVTGAVSDVEDLLTEAKKRGITTILDVSQSAGIINIENFGSFADMIAVTGHKSLLGPTGTGALHMGESIELKPLIVGGTGVRSQSELQPMEYPYRLEAGTKNTASIAGLAAALEWKNNQNSRELSQRTVRLTELLEEGLCRINGVRVIRIKNRRTGTLSFTVKGMTVEEVGYMLQESFGIICRTGLHCAPWIHGNLGTHPEGTVRFSLSCFSTDDEVDYAIDSVKRIAANAL